MGSFGCCSCLRGFVIGVVGRGSLEVFVIVVLIVVVNNDNSISNSSSTMVITNHIIATTAVISIITVLISAVIANVTFSFKIHFTTLIINSLDFLLNFSSF